MNFASWQRCGPNIARCQAPAASRSEERPATDGPRLPPICSTVEVVGREPCVCLRPGREVNEVGLAETSPLRVIGAVDRARARIAGGIETARALRRPEPPDDPPFEPPLGTDGVPPTYRSYAATQFVASWCCAAWRLRRPLQTSSCRRFSKTSFVRAPERPAYGSGQRFVITFDPRSPTTRDGPPRGHTGRRRRHTARTRSPSPLRDVARPRGVAPSANLGGRGICCAGADGPSVNLGARRATPGRFHRRRTGTACCMGGVGW